MSRGRHAECPRGINDPWPERRHVHDRGAVGNSPRTRFIRVRELSMSAFSPPTQARSQPGRIREHVPVSTVREQASAADTYCPQAGRTLELSTSSVFPRVQTLDERYERVLDLLPPDRVAAVDVQHVHWMLEELRVSLFAQMLGTAFPISDKRVLREIERIETGAP